MPSQPSLLTPPKESMMAAWMSATMVLSKPYRRLQEKMARHTSSQRTPLMDLCGLALLLCSWWSGVGELCSLSDMLTRGKDWTQIGVGRGPGPAVILCRGTAEIRCKSARILVGAGDSSEETMSRAVVRHSSENISGYSMRLALPRATAAMLLLDSSGRRGRHGGYNVHCATRMPSLGTLSIH